MTDNCSAVPLVIADAGPLIGLAKADALAILPTLFGLVWITKAVHLELLAQPSSAADVEVLHAALSDGWLRVHPGDPDGFAPLNPGVDPGEASAIGLALQLTNTGQEVLLLIDDRAGRAEARHHRLAITGTAGIAVLAQEVGLIPSALQLLNDLRQVGYFLSDSVLRSVAQRLQSQVPQARS